MKLNNYIPGRNKNASRQLGLIVIMLYVCVLSGAILTTRYVVKHRYYVINLLRKGEANVIVKNSSEPALALFSFQPGISNHMLSSFPHYTIRLSDINSWEVNREEISKIADSIPILITVETWGKNRKSSFLNNPIKYVLKGKYNYVIERLCTQLIGSRPNVYLRFNPEMEVPGTRYPWQQYGPGYIEAFRLFASLCKIYAPQVKQVWGPAGYPGAMEFYPGDDLVDAASITIKSESEVPIKKYPTDYPLAYDLYRRLHRLRFIDKPIFVLGSKQTANDSINKQLVSLITDKINHERSIVYSPENFKRPETRVESYKRREIEIGLYDPQSMLNQEKQVTVEHLFVDFGSLADGAFLNRFNQVVERGHNVIVTFEPFRNPNGETDLQVLRHITEGKYNLEIQKLYSILESTARTVYLRYAHEMEIPVTRYPWQSQDPLTYIKSFRYFMTFQDSLPANIKRIWGPAGDRGSLEWWPGADVVDYVSIAIYGLPDKNITDPEKQESFSTIFNRKYWRFRFIDKPLFITEFGVKGPEEYQTKWLENAAKVIRKNPQIVGVNYFNMSDTPKAWGDIKPPDWSISKKSFYQFLSTLNEVL